MQARHRLRATHSQAGTPRAGVSAPAAGIPPGASPAPVQKNQRRNHNNQEEPLLQSRAPIAMSGGRCSKCLRYLGPSGHCPQAARAHGTIGAHPGAEDGAQPQRELESMRFTIGHNQPRPGAGKVIAARSGCENKRDRSRCGWFSGTRPGAPLAAKPESPPPVLLPLEVVGPRIQGKQDLGVNQARPADAPPGADTRCRRPSRPFAPGQRRIPSHSSHGDERTPCAGSAYDRRSSTSFPQLCSRTMRTKGCERPHIEV